MSLLPQKVCTSFEASKNAKYAYCAKTGDQGDSTNCCE